MSSSVLFTSTIMLVNISSSVVFTSHYIAFSGIRGGACFSEYQNNMK